MKYLVLTGYDKAYEKIGAVSERSWQTYAENHGYQFEVARDYEVGIDARWQKLRIIARALSKPVDFVFWIDADTYCTNPSVELSRWTAESGAHLQASRDWVEQVGDYWTSCAMIMKTSKAMKEVIELARKETFCGQGGTYDQDALHVVTDKNPKFRGFVKVWPRKDMAAIHLNTFPNEHVAAEPWTPGDFLVHFTCVQWSHRERLIKEFENRYPPRKAAQ